MNRSNGKDGLVALSVAAFLYQLALVPEAQKERASGPCKVERLCVL
jgi:hypothetical protein